jgi:hypothetical protein
MVILSLDSHMTGVTSRAEMPSHSGTSEFTSVLAGGFALYFVDVLATYIF